MKELKAARIEIHAIKSPESGIHLEYHILLDGKYLIKFDSGLAAQTFSKDLAKCLMTEYVVVQ